MARLRRSSLALIAWTALSALACASLAGVEDGQLAETGGASGTGGSALGGAAGAGGATGGTGGTAGSTGGAAGAGGATGGTGGASGAGGSTGGAAGAGGATGGTGGSTGGTGGSTGGTGGSTGGTGGSTGGTGGSTGGTGGVTGNKYSQEILADNPIAYWRLDEPAGSMSVADASGNGNTGTATNNKLVFGKPGVSNTAVQFDGTGYLDFGDKFSFDGTASMSVEGWFWPIGDGYGFLGKGDYVSSSGYDGWFFAEGSGVLQVVRGTALITHPSLDKTKFTHVVMTYDGTTYAVYVNGALHSSKASLTSVNKHTHSFRIGNVYQWMGFTGWIDEVALYDKALSSTRIAAHYAAAQ
jgi:hypothetical protein